MTPLGISNYYNDDLFYKHFIVLYFQDDKKMAGKDKKITMTLKQSLVPTSQQTFAQKSVKVCIIASKQSMVRQIQFYRKISE